MDCKYVRFGVNQSRVMSGRSLRGGFTLIELLVVTTILIIITSIVLANNNRFGGVILLENLGYDIALSIREAQIYGISVRQFGSGNFGVGYGMHFLINSPKTYVLFADAITKNGLYDGCPSESSCELVESTDIQRGYFIAGLCVPAGRDSDSCIRVSRADILFKRPEPDACISKDRISAITGNYICTRAQESVRIIIGSPRGDRMSVVVEATGQIATSR